MTESLNPLDTPGIPLFVKILWFLGVPTAFAVWLLWYVLHVQPLQTAALANMANVLAQHEKEQIEKTNEVIRALNYDEAILRAICFAIIPYRNKEEAARCQPLFVKEYEPVK